MKDPRGTFQGNNQEDFSREVPLNVTSQSTLQVLPREAPQNGASQSNVEDWTVGIYGHPAALFDIRGICK